MSAHLVLVGPDGRSEEAGLLFRRQIEQGFVIVDEFIDLIRRKTRCTADLLCNVSCDIYAFQIFNDPIGRLLLHVVARTERDAGCCRGMVVIYRDMILHPDEDDLGALMRQFYSNREKLHSRLMSVSKRHLRDILARLSPFFMNRVSTVARRVFSSSERSRCLTASGAAARGGIVDHRLGDRKKRCPAVLAALLDFTGLEVLQNDHFELNRIGKQIWGATVARPRRSTLTNPEIFRACYDAGPLSWRYDNQSQLK